MYQGFIRLRNLLQNLPGIKRIFGFIFKGVLVFPGVLSAILVIIMCFTSVFTEYLENKQIVFMNIVFVLPGLIQILAVPELIQGVIKLIPFIDFTIVIHKGYYYGVYAYGLMLFNMLVLIIDGVSRPVPPMRPIEMEDEMFRENEDVGDPMHMNGYIEVAQKEIALKIVGGDESELNFAL